MRVLTVKQPYASLIALGVKSFETRTWYTKYRGKILIHSKRFRLNLAEKSLVESLGLKVDSNAFPFGAIVAIADLTDCLYVGKTEKDFKVKKGRVIIPISKIAEKELIVGNWQPGCCAWKLENIKPIVPYIYFKNGNGFRDVPVEIVNKINLVA